MLKLIFWTALVAFVTSREDYKGDVVLRITPKNDGEVVFLKKLLHEGSLELDIWKDAGSPGHNVDIHIKKDDIKKIEDILRRNNIQFEYMINDLQQVVDEETISNQKNAFFSGFDYNKYNRYNDIVNELTSLNRKYPRQTKLFYPGQTYERRRQVGIQISNGAGGNKPIIWIDGGIHAREWISPATVMWLVRYLLQGEGASGQALQKYDFYILPVFNVDGYEYSHTGSRMWRKTRYPYGYGRCVGADPNRNWDSHFGGVGTSSSSCSDSYHGPRAFSEKCVDNVQRYLMGIKNRLKSYWNIHAYSQLLLTPYCYNSAVQPRDFAEIKRVGDIFKRTIENQPTWEKAYFKVGPPGWYLYNAAGGSIDWTYDKLGVKYSYAPELRDKGRYGFVLPSRYIPISGKETSEAIIAAVNAMR